MKKNWIAFAAVIAMAAGAAGCQAESHTETEIVGGWTETDTELTPEMEELFRKASEQLIGVNYTPVKLLEEQLVNGTNYTFLCEAEGVYPGAEKKTVTVTVHVDLDGNAEILNVEESEESGMTGMANPFITVDTIADAEAGAGFSFLAPEEIEGYTISHISYIKDSMIEVIYGNDNEIRVRKYSGQDDISGDYNTYARTEESIIDGLNVTLKLNDKVHTMIWTDGDYSYAVLSVSGIGEAAAECLVSALK